MRRPIAIISSLALLAILAFVEPRQSVIGQEAKKEARLDTLGRPLPEGAIARLGGKNNDEFPSSLWSVQAINGGKQFAYHDYTSNDLQIWDSLRKEKLRSITITDEDHPNIWGACVTPNGELAVVSTGQDVEYDDDGRPKKPPVCRFAILDLRGEKVNPRVIECKEIIQWIVITPDQREFITLSGAEGWCVWNLADGKAVRRVKIEDDRAGRMYLSPDGKRLFVELIGRPAPKPRVVMYDVATGELLKSYDYNGLFMDSTVQFSPDGKFFAIHDSKRFEIFDYKSNAPVPLKFEPSRTFDEDIIGGITFSPDSRSFAANIHGVGIHIWSLDNEKPRVISPPCGYGGSMFFADDRTIVVMMNGSVLHLDTRTGQFQEGIPSYDDEVLDATFAPNKRICTMGPTSLCRWVWQSQQVEQRRDFFRGLVRYCEDDKFGLYHSYSGEDSFLARIDLQVGIKQHVSIPCTHTNIKLLSPDGRIAVKRNYQPTRFECYSLMTGKNLLNLDRDSHSDRPAFLPDSRHLMINFSAPGTPHASVRIYDLHTGKCVRDWSWGGVHTDALVASYDGRRVFALQDYGTLFRIIDVKTGESVAESKVEKRGLTSAMEVSPDGEWVACWAYISAEDCRLRVFATRTGQEVANWQTPWESHARLKFSPDSSLLITTGKTALVWDIAALRKPQSNVPLDEATCLKLWDDLDSDPKTAYAAIQRWIDSPEAAVKFFAQRIQPVPAGALKEIDGLFAQLDDADYAVREKATRDLEALGSSAHAAVAHFLTGNPPAEARQRAERVLARLEKASRRDDRVLETLECIATEPAQELLRQWAKGEPAASLTIQARASLDRLDRRKW